MPSKSKKQQRLFQWALACKNGDAKNCPRHVKDLADSMSKKELEEFTILDEEEIRKSKWEKGDNFPLGDDVMTENTINPRSLELLVKSGNNINVKSIEEKMNENKEEKILGKGQPKGDTFPASKEIPAASKERHVSPYEPPSVDNDKDEKDTSNPAIPSGMEKGEYPEFTPSTFKLPGDKKRKNERRVMDFENFMKIINHQSTVVELTGTKTGKNMREGGASTANLLP